MVVPDMDGLAGSPAPTLAVVCDPEQVTSPLWAPALIYKMGDA